MILIGKNLPAQAVFKFPLPMPIPLTSSFEISMPVGARILTVQAQSQAVYGQMTDVPCIWALVTTSAKSEPRKFFLMGTGHPLPGRADDLAEVVTYHGTFQVEGGEFVWHLFEHTGQYPVM